MADTRKYLYGVPFASPRVRLGFQYIYAPNMDGQFPSKKYEVSWRVPKSDTLFMSLIDTEVLKVFKDNVAKGMMLNTDINAIAKPYRDGDKVAEDKIRRVKALKGDMEKVTKNAAYDRGHWLFKAKSKDKPIIFGYRKPAKSGDPSEAPLPEGLILEMNDEVRLSLQVGVYLLQEDLTEGFNLSFSKVQFMCKGQGGARSGATFGNDEQADAAEAAGPVTFE